MNIDQLFDSDMRTLMYLFLGFGIPLISLALQVFLGWGNILLMIVMFSWLGFAILFYMGITDEETA